MRNRASTRASRRSRTARSRSSRASICGRELKGYTEAIRSIHISERGRFGAARIDATEEHVPALGLHGREPSAGPRAVGTAAAIRAFDACWRRARSRSSRANPTAPWSRCEQGETTTRVRAALVVAADGVRSAVRAALGVATTEHDYGQRAVVFNCSTEAPLDGRAFERFTRTRARLRCCRSRAAARP